MSCRFLFSGDLTIGKFLVVLDDLRLDVVKGEVNVLPVLPDFYLLRFIANQVFFIAVCQKVILLPNLNFHYFWCRKLKSRVKLIDTYLISSVMPFFCQTAFLRRPFHIENTEWTLLCMESRLRSGLYLIAFLSADFGSQCDAGASVEKLRKLLHPVGTSAGSSIPCSTRQRAASDGTPFFNMPNLRNLLRLCLPNSIISVRHTHFEVRASIISMMLASSL